MSEFKNLKLEVADEIAVLAISRPAALNALNSETLDELNVCLSEIEARDDVKVVILGQDPYHGVGEANGLCFSVNEGIKMPPSLNNIYKELYSDLGIKRTSTDLSDWAKSGVLLLNSVLTVEKDKPASHKFIGWEEFTDKIIQKLNEKEKPIVFILWGNFAKSKIKYITNKHHLIISSSHPSPFSVNYGFFGSKPFSRTNEFLRMNGFKEIDW